MTPVGPQILTYAYSPIWDEKTQSLFYIDYVGGIDNRTLYRYDYTSNTVYSAAIDTGFFLTTYLVPIEGLKDQFIIGNSELKTVLRIQWDTKSTTAKILSNKTQVDSDLSPLTNGMDTGVVDPLGQLLTGTYRIKGCPPTTDPFGTVYLFKKNGKIKTQIPNMREVSGFTWNVKEELFYYFDSCDYNIRVCKLTLFIRKITYNSKKKFNLLNIFNLYSCDYNRNTNGTQKLDQ